MEREEERRYLGGSEDFYSSSDWAADSRLAQMAALARCTSAKGWSTSSSAA